MTAVSDVPQPPVILNDIDRVYALQQQRRRESPVTTLAQRIDRIRRIERAVLSRRDEIRKALWDDHRKPAAEVDLAEIYAVVNEARYARRRLRKWMKPKRVPTTLALLGSRSKVIHEPKGVVLIISPWNFPMNLTLGPLVSALAAGNRVVIKPSEITPNMSALIRRIVADLFDESEVAVIEGGPDVAQALLRKRWDHIFFTGSPRVGRIVMRAAAEHLTSVTLELGGKSPVIVDRTANLDEAAKKIGWGKCFNSGQACIAPDYLLVEESVSAEFSAKLKSVIDALGGEESRSALVNDAHAARVGEMLREARQRGATVLAGGGVRGRVIEPTLITNVPADSALMREEIFGPLLPMLTYRSLDEALALIAAREKPLALYVFSRDRAVVRRVLERSTAGGSIVNDAMLHFYQLNLPFGGVGESGMGRAHGFHGFEAFSNIRGVLEQPTRFALIQLMYPPYTSFKRKVIDLTLRYF